MASDPIICKHCGEPFIWQPGKPGYRNECPACLIERTLDSAKPERSELEKYFAASGFNREQIAWKVDRFRRALTKLFRRWGWSEDQINRTIGDLENHPITDRATASARNEH